MAFPVILFGPDGVQYTTNAARQWPLGTRLYLPDGRIFAYAENGATAMVAGNLYQSEVPGANFDDLAVAATAAGAVLVTVTNGVTAIAANDFDGGYMVVQDDVGEGFVYGLRNHAAIAASVAGDINLQTGVSIQVAFTTATTILLVKNEFKGVIIHPSPPTAALVGVACKATAASEFGWLQRHGLAAVLTDGTVVIGESVMPSNATDGSVEDWGLAEAAPPTEIGAAIGLVAEVAVTTEYSLIFLKLE